MKVVVIADTHSLFNRMLEENIDIKEKSKDADLVILLGDHSMGDIKRIEEEFKGIKKIGVLGNHDSEYTYYDTDIVNLHKSQVEINGLKVVGFQGSSKYKSGQRIGFSQEESLDIGMNLPVSDILICHDAPFGYEGAEDDIAHCGLQGILYYIQTKAPKLVLYGHHHHDKWYKIDNTNCLCVYGIKVFEIDDLTCDIRYL